MNSMECASFFQARSERRSQDAVATKLDSLMLVCSPSGYARTYVRKRVHVG